MLVYGYMVICSYMVATGVCACVCVYGRAGAAGVCWLVVAGVWSYVVLVSMLLVCLYGCLCLYGCMVVYIVLCCRWWLVLSMLCSAACMFDYAYIVLWSAVLCCLCMLVYACLCLFMLVCVVLCLCVLVCVVVSMLVRGSAACAVLSLVAG